MAKVVERSLTVLSEVISRDNVQTMSELLALSETKWLIGRTGGFALRIHQRLYGDIMNKDVEGYVLTDSYDLVQTVALFLCEHIGERLEDYCYSTRNGKRVRIKIHCYRLVDRAVCTRYRRSKTNRSFEALSGAIEPRTYMNNEVMDYTKFDVIIARLNLNDYYLTILNCRMSGMSFPEIGRIVNRQISTVWVALNKIKRQYIEITR